MSAALDRLKQQDEQDEQQTQPDGQSRTAETLDSILAAVEAQNTRIERLAEQQTKLAGYVKVMDEETTKRIERVQQLARHSNGTASDARTNERLDELVELQQHIAQSLSGEDFRRELKTLTQATASRTRSADSAADRATAAIQKLDTALAELRAQTQQTARTLDLEDRAQTVARQLREPLDRAEALVGRVERLSRWSWAMGGRLLAGGLLLFVAFAMVSGVLWGIGSFLGVPEISAAIWDAFAATDPWWGKALWAVVGLGFAGAVGYGLWRLLGWLLEHLR